MKLTLPNASSRYGAAMGRRDVLPENRQQRIKLRLTPLRWVDGDYDQWGAYWGQGNQGTRIYCAWGDGEGEEFTTYVFVRAIGREHAKLEVLKKLPEAIFFR